MMTARLLSLAVLALSACAPVKCEDVDEWERKHDEASGQCFVRLWRHRVRVSGTLSCEGAEYTVLMDWQPVACPRAEARR